MIGVIQNTKIFEFRDESELGRALDWFADKYGCRTLIIVDTSDTIKGVVSGGDFTFSPSLNEEQKYYIYGTPQNIADELNKNDHLPSGAGNWEIAFMPFAFCNQRVPKTLDLY